MSEEESTLIRPKCLVVDDLPENIVALKGLLKEEDMDIYSASSGLEALELLLRHEFALALVDVQMPEMDGFELAETMRSTERTKSIPIIFVTAAGNDVRRIFRGYESGAIDFLHKPLYPQVVLGKVRIFLELYQQKKLLEHKLETIRKTEKNLQDALRARDEFLSICSHELKTPLTSLKMQLQLNERLAQRRGEAFAFSPENMRKFIGQADQSVERLIHLVNDMLDISRVNTGRLSLNKETLDVSTLVSDVLDRLSAVMDMAGNEIRAELQDQVIAEVDRFRFEQVLTNLLMNAAKYAPAAPVDVIVKKERSYARVSVRDHGPGITTEDQQRIFERYERAVSPNAITGMGLGLYISKEIVELHRGQISVISREGEGAEFSFTLPLLQ